jgi:hypothetical protein
MACFVRHVRFPKLIRLTVLGGYLLHTTFPFFLANQAETLESIACEDVMLSLFLNVG